jgi:hypothetical protein
MKNPLKSAMGEVYSPEWLREPLSLVSPDKASFDGTMARRTASYRH